MSSRDAVLGRIRAALAADTTTPPPIPRDYIRTGAHPPGSAPAIELMVDRLVDYKAQVHQVSPAELGDAIDTALTGQRSVVVAPDLHPDLTAAAGRTGRTVTTDGAPTALTPNQLDRIDAVVTTATVAIALSGTIVLDGGPARAAAPSPWSPTSTSSSCTPTRSSTPSPKPSTDSTPSDPSP